MDVNKYRITQVPIPNDRVIMVRMYLQLVRYAKKENVKKRVQLRNFYSHKEWLIGEQ